ncbi:MAG: lipid II:glycine glycyltransferase FemX [Verrucomicrobiota bacterium]
MILQPVNPKSARGTGYPEPRWVSPLEIAEWDPLLSTHPAATVFHSRGWAQVLNKTYGYRPQYLVVADQHRLWALLPVFEVSSWLTGRRGICLPFTDECEALESTAIRGTELFENAKDLGRKKKWKYLETRGGANSTKASTSYFEHSLELTFEEQQLFENLAPAMRRAIRKAEKSEVRVESSRSQDALQRYYKLHQLTRRKHGLPPQPISFFENVWSELIQKGHGDIFSAWVGKEVVASAIFLHFGRRVIYKFGASDSAHQDLRANNLLMWHAIRNYSNLGFESLSFGRTSMPQEGLRRFKKAFGATEKILNYSRFSFATNSFVAVPDGASGAHEIIFRNLPLGLSKLCGALLYRHIA